jgi:hypothetical protein
MKFVLAPRWFTNLLASSGGRLCSPRCTPAARDRTVRKFHQLPGRKILLPKLDPIHTGLRGFFCFFYQEFPGKLRRAGQAVPVCNVAEEWFTGWSEGAHWPAPVAN